MTDTPDGPTPLGFDPYGNPGTVVAGELIESAWGNAVTARVVMRFPNKAALDAFAAPNGTLAFTTDASTLWLRNAGVWKATGAATVPTFRFIGGGAGQNVLASTATTCTWAGEAYDDGGIAAGGVVTVPAGWGGRWAFEWSARFPGPSTGVRNVFLAAGAARYGQATLPQTATGDTNIAGSTTVILAAGATASLTVLHTHSGGLLCNQSAEDHFQGRYVGPT